MGSGQGKSSRPNTLPNRQVEETEIPSKPSKMEDPDITGNGTNEGRVKFAEQPPTEVRESTDSRKPRPKSMNISPGGREWRALPTSAQRDKHGQRYSTQRPAPSAGAGVVDFFVPASSQRVDDLAKDVKRCSLCNDRFEEGKKNQKYFCGECEQIFCFRCCNKSKKTKDGQLYFVCNECYWG